MRIFMLIVTAIVLMVFSVAPSTSNEGRGLVVVHTDSHPYLANYLYPHLYQVDPSTGVLEGAAVDNLALVLDPQPTAEREQTFKFRDDLRGGGVKVLYSLLFERGIGSIGTSPYIGEFIEGVELVDEHTLTLRYRTPSCANAARLNRYLMPYSSINSAFESFAREWSATRPGIISIDDWANAYLESGLENFADGEGISLAAEFQTVPNTSSDQATRLISDNLALSFIPTTNGMNLEEQFLTGQTNLLVNPDFERRADLLAQQELQIYNAPGWTWDYLTFNLADTSIPRSAFTSSGAALDQGKNRFFGDLRVRQAVQAGIDVNAIIEVVYQGAATPLAGTLPIASWGYNPALKPTAYDPGRAARLLDAAGWVDTDNDGIRNCFRCTTAERGTSLVLNFSIAYTDQRMRVAEMMALQLQRIGIDVSLNAESDPRHQTFDLHLGGYTYDSPYTFDPDQSALFARDADIVGQMGNIGSYHNPVLDALLEQARTVPDCDVSTRAALYHEAQGLLAEELPMFGLYAVHDFYAARGIQGFAPRPGHPFWNLLNWSVSS